MEIGGSIFIKLFYKIIFLQKSSPCLWYTSCVCEDPVEGWGHEPPAEVESQVVSEGKQTGGDGCSDEEDEEE